MFFFFYFILYVLFQNKQNHKIVFGYSVVDVFSTELFGSESSLLYEYWKWEFCPFYFVVRLFSKLSSSRKQIMNWIISVSMFMIFAVILCLFH